MRRIRDIELTALGLPIAAEARKLHEYLRVHIGESIDHAIKRSLNLSRWQPQVFPVVSHYPESVSQPDCAASRLRLAAEPLDSLRWQSAVAG